MRPLLLALLLIASGASASAQADRREAVSEAPSTARGQRAMTFAELEAQTADLVTPDNAPAYYVVRPGAPLAETPGGKTKRRLRLRETALVLETREDGWSRAIVSGFEGWVPTDALSNIWIRIDKSERTTYVYAGSELLRELPADVSSNPEGDKNRRAGRTEREEHRIPEGTFYVARRFEESDYYLAFVLSYPTPDHAARGLQNGLISQGQYNSILAAHRDFREPPQGTRLG
ncbi:MAG: hypothetical protein AAFQ43_12860, partial [Bacteroidota bacterium]